MKLPRFCQTVAAITLCLALWLPSNVPADQTDDKTPVNAAVVNGKAIPYADFQREVNYLKTRLQAQGGQIPMTAGELNNEVINDLIMRALIFQESVKKGITVDPKSVNDELSAIQLRFGDQKQFDQWMTSVNMDEEKLKEQLHQREAIRSLIEKEIAPNVSVSEDESKEFYKENPTLFQRPEEVHAQHILIKMEKGADDQQKEAARKTLLDLKKRIDMGEDFGELAKSDSQCPSAANNGDLGFFPKGRMVPEFEKAAFELKAGHVSGIVETQFGYHLIKVLERRDGKTLGYEEVQARITANLRNRKMQSKIQEYADKLRETAKIETFVQ